jgi:hypothetical protein
VIDLLFHLQIAAALALLGCMVLDNALAEIRR